ncbi:MAG: glycosyltransferase [Bacteroidales bacterium]|nr:glycosyltransferase [Bacteroidales bacterium]
MGFADFYFERQKDIQVKIEVKPNNDLKYIVVIPCYYEFDIIATLESIWNSERPKSSVEVVIIINSSEDCEEKVFEQNKKTYNEVKNWIAQHEDSLLRFFVLNEVNLPRKFAGAGLARKIGMDQAVWRFNTLNQDRGIVISLDADSIIKENYFTELEKHFEQFPKTNAATIYFEHPIEGNEFEQVIYEAIITYELYLRYYKQALKYTGFPYSMHTVGSCFAINAMAYAKQGGMNRKKAGEDFYLLHKVFPLGHYYEINTTCVYPSPRTSDRVPFGTGPMVKSIIESTEEVFLTYNIDSFLELKSLFKLSDDLFKISLEEFDVLLKTLPECIREFLKKNDFFNAIQEINNNSSKIETFTKRLFDWFNAFRILKYLNFAHESYYQKQALLTEAEKFVELLNLKNDNIKTYKNYLELFRKLERQF